MKGRNKRWANVACSDDESVCCFQNDRQKRSVGCSNAEGCRYTPKILYIVLYIVKLQHLNSTGLLTGHIAQRGEPERTRRFRLKLEEESELEVRNIGRSLFADRSSIIEFERSSWALSFLLLLQMIFNMDGDISGA